MTTWTMPEDWADGFDPGSAEWRQARCSEITSIAHFRDIADRGWSGGLLQQRDFWVRELPGRERETLVIEWSKPWAEVIAVIRDGVVITDMPGSREEFDSFWKIRMEPK